MTETVANQENRALPEWRSQYGLALLKREPEKIAKADEEMDGVAHRRIRLEVQQ